VLQILSIAAVLLCLWFLAKRFFYREAELSRQRVTSRHYAHSYKRIPRDPEEQYVEGVGYIIGDASCKYNAHSPYMRCAINPGGLCEGCRDYHAQSIQRSF
jgi:Family of unknown function (DUF6464)